MTEESPLTHDELSGWEEFAPQHEPEPRRSFDMVAWIAVGIAIVTLGGLLLLWPSGAVRDQASLDYLGVPSEFYAAEIVSVEEAPCAGVSDLMCTVVTFELRDGPDAGAGYIQSFPPSTVNPEFTEGDVAILSRRSPNGVVTGVDTGPCPFDEAAQCRILSLRVEVNGTPTVITYVATNQEPAARLLLGDPALVELFPDAEVPEALVVSPPDVEIAYQFSGDFQRRPLLLATALIFAAAVIAIGRWRGVAALGGLVASLGILLLFILPAILDGKSPVLVAVVGAAAIAFVTLYLAHGFTRMTTVALLGMVAALALTALLSAAVVELARFSGFASEESTLLTLFEGVDVAGLLLAGIVLGTAGALDDVTVTQASAVWALRAADPDQGRVMLFRRALQIGRDHIASTVNTLLLAYAGAALPLLVLFVLSEQSLGTIANSEVVAVEIVRTLVGSIGLVAAVPITTWLAARAAHRAPAARR